MNVSDQSGWSFITIEVPPSRIDAAIDHPDALQIAYDVGVLELLSIGLSLLGVALIFAGFGAYISIRRAARDAAQQIARRHVPSAVDDHIRRDGFAVLKEVMKDPETLAAMQAAMEKLGLTDATDAGNVTGELLEAFNAAADR